MENKLPETLKKQISLIKGALDSDSDRRNPEYSKILKKTEAREAVYDMLARKIGNLDVITDEISKKSSEVMENLKNDLINSYGNASGTKKDLEWLIFKMTQNATEYYYQIGQMINDYGLLDVLISRNDKTLTKSNLQFLKVDHSRALKEFDKINNSRQSYGVVMMKILFQLNKMAKFLQDIEFGTMLNLDRRNAKTSCNDRIQILSNLKTNYLKKVLEEQNVMNDEELQQFREEGMAKKEYIRLFENDFNINYEEDLKRVKKYEEKIKEVYVRKSELTEMIMLLLLNVNYRKMAGKGVKCCGVCKDNVGRLVFGMNIQGYIMPVTVHVSKSDFQAMLEKEYLLQNAQMGYRKEYEIEEYVPLKGKDGKIITTNLLYKIDKLQMENLRIEAKKRPDDQVVQFYAKQLAKDEKTENNRIKAEELLK